MYFKYVAEEAQTLNSEELTKLSKLVSQSTLVDFQQTKYQRFISKETDTRIKLNKLLAKMLSAFETTASPSPSHLS